MKIGVWGVGNIGTGLVYRLVTLPFVSEIVWINRSLDKLLKPAADISHGLSFAPNCWNVNAVPQAEAAGELADVSVLVVTIGDQVKAGETRADVYENNARIFREGVIPVLRDNFNGVVLVISNPVDLMARLLHVETGLPANRVIGLGTVVETSRLRGALAKRLVYKPRPADVWPYAIGTHDENFIPVVKPPFALGDSTDPKIIEEAMGKIREYVITAPERVKTDNASSLYPIVEGAIKVIETIVMNTRQILTVSVLAPETNDQLFYSLPCRLNKNGVESREDGLLEDKKISAAIDVCCEGLRKILNGPRD